MKKLRFLISLVSIGIIASATSLSQVTANEVKTTISPNPVFPAEANNYVYGESVSVAISVDRIGKVVSARALGPRTPCSNLKDPMVDEVRRIARVAAMSTVFEPILKEGKPVEASLVLTYRLRPRQITAPEDERNHHSWRRTQRPSTSPARTFISTSGPS